MSSNDSGIEIENNTNCTEETITNENKDNIQASSSHDSENIKLTDSQKAQIERNRQQALLKRQRRLIAHPYAKKSQADTIEKSVVRIKNSKFIDTGGGFLLEEKDEDDILAEIDFVEDPPPIVKPDRPKCLECNEEIAVSYLLQHFDYSLCDRCKEDGDYKLITRTEAKNSYLLKDVDLDKREPPLKYILKTNPHNSNWGEMRLYLEKQVYDRSMHIWGSEEKIEEELEKREENKVKSKVKKYNKQMKELRKTVRSSLFDKTSKASHVHEFGSETYDEENDEYHHVCKICNFEETFEKM